MLVCVCVCVPAKTGYSTQVVQTKLVTYMTLFWVHLPRHASENVLHTHPHIAHVDVGLFIHMDGPFFLLVHFRHSPLRVHRSGSLNVSCLTITRNVRRDVQSLVTM